MNTRDRVRQKICALRAKTAARGCTEEEALAAAAKAAELMREYNLTDHEIEMETAQARSTAGKRSVRASLWSAIAWLTNCAVVVDHADRYTFHGEGAGPEVAAYLMAICDRAIDRAVRDFRQTTWYKRRRTLAAKRRAGEDFVAGMVARLARRLQELFHDGRNEASAARAVAARDAACPDLVSVSLRVAPGRYDAAADAGWSAGADVGLHHGVRGADAPKLIGGGS
jgi:hypothetical protein